VQVGNRRREFVPYGTRPGPRDPECGDRDLVFALPIKNLAAFLLDLLSSGYPDLDSVLQQIEKHRGNDTAALPR
jgi:hypothetical protein